MRRNWEEERRRKEEEEEIILSSCSRGIHVLGEAKVVDHDNRYEFMAFGSVIVPDEEV